MRKTKQKKKKKRTTKKNNTKMAAIFGCEIFNQKLDGLQIVNIGEM